MLVGYTLIESIKVIPQRMYSDQFRETNSGFIEREKERKKQTKTSENYKSSLSQLNV